MNKKDILSALTLHGIAYSDGTVRFSRKALDKAVDEVWTLVQKDLGKETRKKNTEYADPNGVYHPHERMNSKLQEFILARKEIRKPITKRAIEQLMEKFKKGGFTVGECVEALDTAIVGGYQGVFPKKKFIKASWQNPDPATTDYTEGLPINRKTTTR